jgi:hypothetical protein
LSVTLIKARDMGFIVLLHKSRISPPGGIYFLGKNLLLLS